MKRILIAHFDQRLIRSMDVFLTLKGNQVICVYNADEALNKILKQSFDLLITDISYRKFGGKKLINEVKFLNPHLPIMAVSMNHNENFTNEMANEGIVWYRTKQFTRDEFSELIDQILN